MDYRKKDIRNALLFISPWIIGFLVFTLYPILSSLYYSFCEYKVIKAPVFIGFKNYIDLFKDKSYFSSTWQYRLYVDFRCSSYHNCRSSGIHSFKQ